MNSVDVRLEINVAVSTAAGNRGLPEKSANWLTGLSPCDYVIGANVKVAMVVKFRPRRSRTSR